MIWEIDSVHSQVSFSIRVVSVTTTRGRFKALRGRLSLDTQHHASSWVEAEVDAASIGTHNAPRDAHLRSSGFFAVKKYPTITFQSTNVEHLGGSAYKVTGNMTLHGVTKPITFDVEYSGQSAGLGMRTGLTAKATISRKDFGLGQGMAVRFAASDRATVEIALEAVQKSMKVPEAVVKAE